MSPFPKDGPLQDSLLYLRELLEEDGLRTLENIWDYFQERKKQAKVFIFEMMGRVDRNQFSGELDNVVSLWMPGTVARAVRKDKSFD